MRSNLTTLCYIEKEDSYLMLHRVKKEEEHSKKTKVTKTPSL